MIEDSTNFYEIEQKYLVVLDSAIPSQIGGLIKKQKKPIVILNKIDNGKMKKAPPQQQNYPTAIFV